MRKFVLTISILTFSIVLVGSLLFSMIIPEYYLNIFPFILLFFAITSIITHALQMHLLKKDFAKFTRNNMLITFAKLIVYAVFSIICILTYPQYAISIVVAIMMFYVIFTTTEVISLIEITKKQKG